MMQRSAPPPFPEALNDDDDDVTWALQTAGVQWRRGAHGDAIEWLRRAVESAVDGGKATRARDIQQQANAIEAAIRAGWKPGSAAPDPAAAPWSSRPASNSRPPDERPFPLRTPRPAANPFLSGPTDNPFLTPAPAPVRRPSGLPPPPTGRARPGFEGEGAEHDAYNELAVDIDVETESARGVPTERSRFDPTSSGGKTPEVVEELPLDEVEEFDDQHVIALSSGSLPGLGRARMPFVSAPELETGPVLEADDALAQDIDDDEDDNRPTLPPSSSSRDGVKAPAHFEAPRVPPPGTHRGRVQTVPFPLPRLPEARPSSLPPLPTAPARGNPRPDSRLPVPPSLAQAARRNERGAPDVRPREGMLRSEPAPSESLRVPPSSSGRPRTGRPKFAYTPDASDSEAPKAELGGQTFIGSSTPSPGRDDVSLPPIMSMPADVLSLPPSIEPLPLPTEEEPTDRTENPGTGVDEDLTERSIEATDSRMKGAKSFSEPPSEETTERDLDAVPGREGAPSSGERSRAPDSEPGTSPDLKTPFTEDKPPSVAPDTENEAEREARHHATVAQQGPAELGGVLLGSVPGLEDLPDESQAELAASASLVTLAASEEVSGFGLALVLEGAVAVMPTIADVAAAHARRGELVFGKTHVEEGVPMRVVAGPEGAKVATWPTAAFDAAVAACPWVGDDLLVVGDRLQTLVGVAMGAIGDQLDDMLRAMVIERCEVRYLLPGEALVEMGKPIPGMIVMGAGRLEITGPEGSESPGPGEFVFASQVLQAAPAPATARAGKGGALILFAARKTSHELMVSVPPLLGIFAQ